MILFYYAPVAIFMYRGVFTVGIALIGVKPGGDNTIVSANALTDNLFVNVRSSGINSGVQIARCVTGLGPNPTENNSPLGGVYFNGSRLTFETCMDSSPRLVHPRAAGLGNPGVINIIQCGTSFTTALEGIYTCVMRNSSMINESINFGVYFSERSKSFDFVYHIT